jgi:hypothetical protein
MLKKLLVISFILLGLGQISLAQKGVTPAKKKLAKQLTERTSGIMPSAVFETAFFNTIDKSSTDIEQKVIGDLTKLVETSDMSDEKKTEVKLKIPEFSKHYAEVAKNLFLKDLTVKLWIEKSLEKSYLQKFTVAELTKLNKFFGTADGELFIKFFSEQITAAQEGKEAEATSPETERVFEQMEKVAGKTASGKLLDVAVKNATDDILKEIDVWGNQMLKTVQKASTGNGVLKREIDKFIEESR